MNMAEFVAEKGHVKPANYLDSHDKIFIVVKYFNAYKRLRKDWTIVTRNVIRYETVNGNGNVERYPTESDTTGRGSSFSKCRSVGCSQFRVTMDWTHQGLKKQKPSPPVAFVRCRRRLELLQPQIQQDIMPRRKLSDLRIVRVPPMEEETNSDDLSSEVPNIVENVEIEAENGRIRKIRGRPTLKELYQLPPGDYNSWREMPNSNKNQVVDYVKEKFSLEKSCEMSHLECSGSRAR
ncbi:hypothetical protein V6N13_076966 [Hibiscus sabdariffa]|uniref:Uncharacterized protein n=1 Tax=Hibiscus sabdariffa TaxID=183260 RepID=A0ABR2CMG2_9ROSI